jgi:hypothetical protein
MRKATIGFSYNFSKKKKRAERQHRPARIAEPLDVQTPSDLWAVDFVEDSREHNIPRTIAAQQRVMWATIRSDQLLELYLISAIAAPQAGHNAGSEPFGAPEGRHDQGTIVPGIFARYKAMSTRAHCPIQQGSPGVILSRRGWFWKKKRAEREISPGPQC